MSHTAPQLTARLFLTPYGQLAASLIAINELSWCLYYTLSHEGYHCQGGYEYTDNHQATNQLMSLHQGDANDIALLLVNVQRKEDGLPEIEKHPDHISSSAAHIFPSTPIVLQ